ncbi:MAG: hypothetical protein Q8M58_13505 [Anaerolineales bacterium]|nr:hypothetical protein [Anaerolineales bacterium]
MSLAHRRSMLEAWNEPDILPKAVDWRRASVCATAVVAIEVFYSRDDSSRV